MNDEIIGLSGCSAWSNSKAGIKIWRRICELELDNVLQCKIVSIATELEWQEKTLNF